MARATTPGFACRECGWTSVKWVGRCGECQVYSDIRRDRIEAAERNQSRSGFFRLGLVAFDHAANEGCFAGDVEIITAVLRAGCHHRLAMNRKGTCEGQDDFGLLHHRFDGFWTIGISQDDLWFPFTGVGYGLQLLLISSGYGHAQSFSMAGTG